MLQQSSINDLKKRVQKRKFDNYLYEISFSRMRSFTDQKVRFDFPVTAVIGTNGGGKSTVLGSAGLAYASIKPREFFPKSTVSDSSMAGWRVDFDLEAKNEGAQGKVSAKFVDKRWRRDNSRTRSVVYFPIQRTVPAGEVSRFRKFIGSDPVENHFYEELNEQVVTWTSRILGRDTGSYRKIFLKDEDEDYILVGKTGESDFSQFHFGAGEASIIEIVNRIEGADNSSLILIEEIENGLHPKAVVTLIEYLVDVAIRKRVQVVFTTHSSRALAHLPPEAVWACVDGKLQQGILSIDSLRAMIGDVEKSRVVFAEDQFACDWIEDAIRQADANFFHEVELHATGGYPYNLQQTDYHNKNPSINGKSIAVALIDGDQEVDAKCESKVAQLPGGIPEDEVFQNIFAKIDDVASKVQQRCNLQYLSIDEIKARIESVRVENKDPHDLFREMSERFDFVSEIIIRKAFISLYNELNSAAMSSVVENIKNLTEHE
jgi:predicted ATPase